MKQPHFNLVGFTGRAGAGKSTAAQVIVDRLQWNRKSFATPIRKMLEAFGVFECRMSDPLLKHLPLESFGGKSPRQLMQSLGTEWGRNCVHPDIWVILMREQIRFCRDVTIMPGVVIDDVRFDNEARMIRELGGVVIKIELTGANVGERMAHASENGVSPELIDLTVQNVEGAPEILKAWVAEQLEKEAA